MSGQRTSNINKTPHKLSDQISVLRSLFCLGLFPSFIFIKNTKINFFSIIILISKYFRAGFCWRGRSHSTNKGITVGGGLHHAYHYRDLHKPPSAHKFACDFIKKQLFPMTTLTLFSAPGAGPGKLCSVSALNLRLNSDWKRGPTRILDVSVCYQLSSCGQIYHYVTHVRCSVSCSCKGCVRLLQRNKESETCQPNTSSINVINDAIRMNLLLPSHSILSCTTHTQTTPVCILIHILPHMHTHSDEDKLQLSLALLHTHTPEPFFNKSSDLSTCSSSVQMIH